MPRPISTSRDNASHLAPLLPQFIPCMNYTPFTVKLTMNLHSPWLHFAGSTDLGFICHSLNSRPRIPNQTNDFLPFFQPPAPISNSSPFPSKSLLPSSVCSSKFRILEVLCCHSYENCGVYPLSSLPRAATKGLPRAPAKGQIGTAPPRFLPGGLISDLRSLVTFLSTLIHLRGVAADARISGCKNQLFLSHLPLYLP